MGGEREQKTIVKMVTVHLPSVKGAVKPEEKTRGHPKGQERKAHISSRSEQGSLHTLTI